MRELIVMTSFVAASAFGLDVTAPGQLVTNTTVDGDIVFTTDGASLSTSGVDSVRLDNIIVNKGVSATLGTEFPTRWGIAYRLIGSQPSYIKGGEGATKDDAVLLFDGYILGTGATATSKTDLTVENITLNLQRAHNEASDDKNNLLRAAYLDVVDANINVLAPVRGAHSEIQANVHERVDGAVQNRSNMTLTRSSLKVFEGAKLLLNLGGGSGNMAKLQLSDNSSIIVDGTLAGGVREVRTLSYRVDASSSILVGSTGRLELSSGDSNIELSGRMVIDGYVMTNSKVRLNKGGTLVLNSSNLSQDMGMHTTNANGDLNVYGSSTLEVNAQTYLRGICVTSDASKTLTVRLGDRGDASYLLALDYIVCYPNSTAYYESNNMNKNGNSFFYDFIGLETGDVLFSKETVSEDEIKAALSNMLFDGESGIIGYDSVTVDGKDYWVLTAAVPEPATFAALFGILALSFAAYRRKRQ